MKRSNVERDAATPLASQPLRECGQGCRINLVSRHHEDDVRVWGSGVGATRGQSEAVAVVHAVTVFAEQVPVVQGTPGEAVGMAQHLDRRREAEEREGRGEAEGDLAGHGGRVAHSGPVDCSASGCPNMTDIDQIMVVVLAFKAAGCSVEDGIVRMDRALVMQLIATAPERFTLHSRNPDRNIEIGGNVIHFGLVSGPPNVHDCVQGRRPGNFADYQTLIKLGQSFNVISFFGNQAIAPTDLPANNRHLDTTLANLTLSDKVFLATGIGAGRARDAVELCALARGETLEGIADSPSVVTNINVNSPRKLDDAMAYGLMQMAQLGQVTVVTPFTLMGAMTPATMAGALVQQKQRQQHSRCPGRVRNANGVVGSGHGTWQHDLPRGRVA